MLGDAPVKYTLEAPSAGGRRLHKMRSQYERQHPARIPVCPPCRTRLNNMIESVKNRLLACLLILATLPFAASAASPTAIPEPGKRLALFSLANLGFPQGIELRGVDGSVEVPFGIRLDEMATQARLTLEYSLSPALLPDLSHLRVFLNNELQATVPVTKDAAPGKQTLEISLDPKFLSDFNKLKFQLIGHYTTTECEFPFHTSLWAQIGARSSLALELKNIGITNDLAILPAPFFDKRDSRRLVLPMAFGKEPPLEVLKAAASVSSWLGSQAAYRGARFPAYLDHLPSGNAVVFATSEQRPQFLSAYPPIEAPGIALIDNPADRFGKLLLILGRNAEEVKIAADALSLGKIVLAGDKASIARLEYPAPREAYDAPNWVRTGRVIRLGELVQAQQELQVKGQILPPIRLNARLPPDLFTWDHGGITVDLKYRYTAAARQPDATLTTEINNRLVDSIPLQAKDAASKNRFLRSILGSAREQGIVIPAFHLGSNNQLQFQFSLAPPAGERHCGNASLLESSAAIDPDSTLDLTGFHHYAAMPNLAFFANGGYPFTRHADLSRTTVVLPDEINPAIVETLLNVMGRMGASTGYPALRVKIVQAKNAGKIEKEDDLLVVSGGDRQDFLARYGAALPGTFGRTERRFLSDRNAGIDLVRLWPTILEGLSPPLGGKTELQATGKGAALIGFESPFAKGRSVVALTASSDAGLPEITHALEDADKIRQIRGAIAVIRGKEIESFAPDKVYYVGELPWWRQVWFQLHRYPIVITLSGVVLGILLSVLGYNALKRRAEHRAAGK